MIDREAADPARTASGGNGPEGSADWWEGCYLKRARDNLLVKLIQEELIAGYHGGAAESMSLDSSVSATTSVFALHLALQCPYQGFGAIGPSNIEERHAGDSTAEFVTHHLRNSLTLAPTVSGTGHAIIGPTARTKAEARSVLLGKGTAYVANGNLQGEEQVVQCIPLQQLVVDSLIELTVNLLLEEIRSRSAEGRFQQPSPLVEAVLESVPSVALFEEGTTVSRGGPQDLTSPMCASSGGELLLLMWLKRHVIDPTLSQVGSPHYQCIMGYTPTCCFCSGFFRPDIAAFCEWGVMKRALFGYSPDGRIRHTVLQSSARSVLSHWKRRHQMAVKRRIFGAWAKHVLDPYHREARQREERFLRGCIEAHNRRRVALKHQRSFRMKLQRTFLMSWWQYAVQIAPLARKREATVKRECLKTMVGIKLTRLADCYSRTHQCLSVLRRWREALWSSRYRRQLLSRILQTGVNTAKVARFQRFRVVRPLFQKMQAMTVLSQARLYLRWSQHRYITMSHTSRDDALGMDAPSAEGRRSTLRTEGSSFLVEAPDHYSGTAPSGISREFHLPDKRTIVLAAFRGSSFRGYRPGRWRDLSAGRAVLATVPQLPVDPNWLMGPRHSLQQGAFTLWRRSLENRRVKEFRRRTLEHIVAARLVRLVALRLATRTVDANRDVWLLRAVVNKWHTRAILVRPQTREEAALQRRFLGRHVLVKWRRRLDQRRRDHENERLADRHRRYRTLSRVMRHWVPLSRDIVNINFLRSVHTASHIARVLGRWNCAAIKEASIRRKEEDVADWFRTKYTMGQMVFKRWMARASVRRASVWLSPIPSHCSGKDRAVVAVSEGDGAPILMSPPSYDSKQLKAVIEGQLTLGGLTSQEMKRLRVSRQIVLDPVLSTATHRDPQSLANQRRQRLAFQEIPPTAINESAPEYVLSAIDIADRHHFHVLLHQAFRQWRSSYCLRNMLFRHIARNPAAENADSWNPVTPDVGLNMSRSAMSNTRSHETRLPPSDTQRLHRDSVLSIDLSSQDEDDGQHGASTGRHPPIHRQHHRQHHQVYVANSRPPLTSLLKAVLNGNGGL